MTADHPLPYKAYSSGVNIFLNTPTYCLASKLLSVFFLITAYSSCLLSMLAFSCNQTDNCLPQVVKPPPSVARLSNKVGQPIGSVTTLDMDDPVSFIMVAHDKWEKGLIKSLLYGKRCIAPQKLIRRHVAFQRSDIASNATLSDHLSDPIDGTIPNWKAYGIAPRMVCTGSSCGNKHTFTLALDGAKFQNSEALGFILVKNNSRPEDLVKHLVEKLVPWPDEPHAHMAIKDYLILPGVISTDLLQAEYSFDSIKDLNSYSTLYCYLKSDHHYCFIRLAHSVPKVHMRYSAYSPCSNGTASPRIATSQSAPEKSSVVALPVTPSSLKNNSALSKKLKDDAIVRMQQEALSEILNNIKTFKTRQEWMLSKIKSIKITESNDEVKNKIRLGHKNKIALALSPALKAVQRLQSALKQEDSTPTHLRDKRIAVIQALNNLEAAVDQEYSRTISVVNLLTRTIEALQKMYDESFTLFKIDAIDSMQDNLKLLFNRKLIKLNKNQEVITQLEEITFNEQNVKNRTKLKKAQEAIAQLEKITLDQQNVAKRFRQEAPEIETVLVARQNDLQTLIDKSLKKIRDKISPNFPMLCCAINWKGMILVVEGKLEHPKWKKGIITELELVEETIKEIKAILKRVDLNNAIAKIAKEIEEAVNKALDLENRFQTKIEETVKQALDLEKQLQAEILAVKEMVDQRAILQAEIWQENLFQPELLKGTVLKAEALNELLTSKGRTTGT